jgi:hypothetical protein
VVALLADVLAAAAAVLVQPPHVRPESLDEFGQAVQVAAVHGADDGADLQPRAGLAGDEFRRVQCLGQVGLGPAHGPVHAGRGSVDGQSHDTEGAETESLLHPPGQQRAVGVQDRPFPGAGENAGVFVDLADQERLAAAERHGRGR